MTRLDALKALAEKVEAGDSSWDADFLGQDENVLVLSAWHGSLDAAKALHEAVLPRAPWHVTSSGVVILDCAHGAVVVRPEEGLDPARAWLLAILRALIAQEAAE